jgi:C-terminal peptidase prc
MKRFAAFWTLLLVCVSTYSAFALPSKSPAEHDCVSLLALVEAKHPLPVAEWPSELIFSNFLHLIDPIGVYFSDEDAEALATEHGSNFVQSIRENVFRVPKLVFEAAAKRALERRAMLKARSLKLDAFSNRENRQFSSSWKTGRELDLFWESHFERLRESWIAAGASTEEMPQLLANSLEEVGAELIDSLKTESAYFRTLSGALLGSLDPYSRLEPPRPVPRKGPSLGLLVKDFAGVRFISGFEPGSSAETSGGLQPGDEIVSVFIPETGQFNFLVAYPRKESLDLVPTFPGSSIRIGVYRSSESKFFEIELKREPPNLPPSPPASTSVRLFKQSVKKKTYLIGVIRIDGFFDGPEQTSATMEHLIKFLKVNKVGVVLLDLRDNNGGSLVEVYNALALFLSKKELEYAVGATDLSPSYQATRSKPIWNGPLVVLTSHRSASGAELLAGNLQEFRRALSIGDLQTFGKGTMQTAFAPGWNKRADPQTADALEDPGTPIITSGYFFLPSGRSPQQLGFGPDIVFPWSKHQKVDGESSSLLSLPPASRPMNPGFKQRTEFWREDFQWRLQYLLDQSPGIGEEEDDERLSESVLNHALVVSALYLQLLREQNRFRFRFFNP